MNPINPTPANVFGKKMFLSFAVVALTTACVSAGTNSAANAEPSNGVLETVDISEVEWGALNPERGKAGPRAGDLWGDRTVKGPTGFLAKFEPEFASPPHIHNVSYSGVVISGRVHNDDPAAENMWLQPGSYWTQPAGDVHITSADGASNMAYIEINDGPYLVRPTTQAFDNGEASINVDEKNVVWMDASEIAWMQGANSGVETAFLWGNPTADASYGSLIKFVPGHVGVIHPGDASFRAVVIEGQAKVASKDQANSRTLSAGSYFGGDRLGAISLTCSTEEACTLYIRADNQFELRSK